MIILICMNVLQLAYIYENVAFINLYVFLTWEEE